MQLHQHTCGLELRSLDQSTGEFEGYASVFDNLIPSYNERVKPGAFTKTLKENGGKVPILFNHYDWIGMGQAGTEDGNGLKVRGKLAIDKVRQASEAWALMGMAAEVKKPTGLSIGFRSVKDQYGKDGVREILEAQLIEYSVTPFPANEAARILDMRSSIDALYRRNIITADQRQRALVNWQAAPNEEPDALHSIAEALDRALNNLRAA